MYRSTTNSGIQGAVFSSIEQPLVTNSKVIYLDTEPTYVQFRMIRH